MERRSKSKIQNIFSTIVNFICAFIIFGIIVFSIGILVTADANSKKVTGNYESQIFSYNAISYMQAEVTAFGETITIDFEKINDIKQKASEITKINESFMPSILIISGELIKDCLTSAAKILNKLPTIATRLYNQ